MAKHSNCSGNIHTQLPMNNHSNQCNPNNAAYKGNNGNNK